jgi:hypothetical protein
MAGGEFLHVGDLLFFSIFEDLETFARQSVHVVSGLVRDNRGNLHKNGFGAELHRRLISGVVGRCARAGGRGAWSYAVFGALIGNCSRGSAVVASTGTPAPASLSQNRKRKN